MWRRILTILCLLGLAGPLLADDNLLEHEDSPARIDRSKDWLAKRIGGVSESLDSFFIERFFGDKILDDNTQGSRAIISLHTRREIGGEVEYFFDGRVKLVLPHTSDRLKLLISSDDDSEYSVERDPIKNIENASYSTALRLILSESHRWATDLDVGATWDAPPDPYVRLRFRRRLQIGQWHTQFTQSFYHYALDKSGEKTDIYGDYNLSGSKLLRLSTTAKYKRKDGYFNVDYGISLYHRLKNKAVLSYVLGASGDTEKDAVFKHYYAGVRFRRLIYKDWIFAEIFSSQEWDLDNDFRRQAVVMFRIEAIIE